MRKSSLAILASCAALLAGVIVPSVAQADATTVTIEFVDRPNNDVFRGFVESPNPNCVENRKVRLFRVAPGADIFIDRDRSEDSGKWAIDIEGGAPAGDYYVKVAKRTVGAVTCDKARSETITVP